MKKNLLATLALLPTFAFAVEPVAATGQEPSLRSTALTFDYSDNLLLNGSFENDLDGWDHSFSDETAPATAIYYGAAEPYPYGAYGESIPADDATGNPGYDDAGSRGAYFSDDFAQNETLSQFVQITAGTQYVFGFDAYLPALGYANEGDATVAASIGGFTFAAFSASGNLAQTWVHYSATGVAGGDGLALFQFAFNADGWPAKDVVIDRVYFAPVTDPSPVSEVPEPETLALMLAGLVAVGFAARRRRD